MSDNPNPRAVVCKVSELKPFDRIVSGTILGPLAAAETLTVKVNEPGDYDKYAVTFFGVGTVFLHKGALVEIIPARESHE